MALIPGLKQTLGMSQADLALVLKVNPRTVDRWLAGDTPQRNKGRERLEELDLLANSLKALFGSPQRIQAWMGAENAYLGQLTPAEALRAGRMDRVNAALHALMSGAPV